MQLSPAVEALVHVSELGNAEGVDPEKIFTLNQRKEFVVLDVEKKSQDLVRSPSTKKKNKRNPINGRKEALCLKKSLL